MPLLVARMPGTPALCPTSVRSFRASCLLLSQPCHPMPLVRPLIEPPAPQEFASDRVIVSFKPDVVRAMAAEEEGLKFQKPAGLQVRPGSPAWSTTAGTSLWSPSPA